jgi:hypothetical protein
MNIVELVKAAHENAVNKGWWTEERTYGELIVLMQSEVSEALEDHRNGLDANLTWYEKMVNGELLGRGMFVDETWKPCGIPSELADIIIRIFDCCGRYGWAEQFDEIFNQVENLEIVIPEICVSRHLPFAENLLIINGWLVDSYRANEPYESVYYLALAAADTRLLATNHGIDLDAAIAEKMAYNATRPIRHGGKVL